MYVCVCHKFTNSLTNVFFVGFISLLIALFVFWLLPENSQKIRNICFAFEISLVIQFLCLTSTLLFFKNNFFGHNANFLIIILSTRFFVCLIFNIFFHLSYFSITSVLWTVLLLFFMKRKKSRLIFFRSK